MSSELADLVARSLENRRQKTGHCSLAIRACNTDGLEPMLRVPKPKTIFMT
jgi:hypothetical protein